MRTAEAMMSEFHHEPIQEPMVRLCGHPESSVMTSGDGVVFCVGCETSAREHVVFEPRQDLLVQLRKRDQRIGRQRRALGRLEQACAELRARLAAISDLDDVPGYRELVEQRDQMTENASALAAEVDRMRPVVEAVGAFERGEVDLRLVSAVFELYEKEGNE